MDLRLKRRKDDLPLVAEQDHLIRMDTQGRLITTEPDHLVRMDAQGRLIGSPVPPPPVSAAFKNALLLLDTSESMRDGHKFTQSREGAMQFAVSAVEKRYLSGLIVFGDNARLITRPTGDLKAFSKALAGTSVSMLGPSTNMAQAFALALDTPEISAVVAVTDGQPTQAEEALYFAHQLKERGVDIIAIGTYDADYNFLSQIATRQDLALAVADSNLQLAIGDASRLLAG